MNILYSSNVSLFILYFLFPFARILSFIATVPLFENRFIGYKIKFILSVVITYLIIPFIPTLEIISLSYISIVILIQQILIGTMLGLTIQWILSIGQIAGEIVGLQMGLSFSTIFDSTSRTNVSIISRFFYILFSALLMSCNIHIWIILILVYTFYTIPISQITLNSIVFIDIVKFFSIIFSYGMMLILPIMVILLILNGVMSIFNRIVSQISFFSIGLPITLLTGMFMLYMLLVNCGPYLKNLSQFLMLFFMTILSTLK
ncbi:flagellar biosynthetic protein FliR [Buchnera aphidicola (Formosaphis micheliae)]|uniref:flagellar biosynthetic protein FliR n=1 Tax=Buchnera aphidicola TaxID=9 RepID=UPI0031B84B50